MFNAIAIESRGEIKHDADALFSRLVHFTTSISRERRQADVFQQSLSLVMIRGNSQGGCPS